MIRNYSTEFLKPEWYSDYLLVQEVLDGNIKIWNRLYRNSYPLVYNYVNRNRNRWLISHDETKDVVSEAFKRCYFKLSSYNGKSKFSTWVCGFCRYILLNYYHKYRLQNKYIVDIFNTSQLSNIYGNPEKFVIEKERNLCLWTAYNSLTFKHRMLLDCYIFNEIKPNQVKKILRLNFKDINNELTIAINALRNRFLSLYEKM